MDTQTNQKVYPSIRDIGASTKLRKILALNFLFTGIGITLILSIGTFLGF